jgi:hypothetical protein
MRDVGGDPRSERKAIFNAAEARCWQLVFDHRSRHRPLDWMRRLDRRRINGLRRFYQHGRVCGSGRQLGQHHGWRQRDERQRWNDRSGRERRIASRYEVLEQLGVEQHGLPRRHLPLMSSLAATRFVYRGSRRRMSDSPGLFCQAKALDASQSASEFLRRHDSRPAKSRGPVVDGNRTPAKRHPGQQGWDRCIMLAHFQVDTIAGLRARRSNCLIAHTAQSLRNTKGP